MNRTLWLILALLLASLFVSACSEETTETPTLAPTEAPTPAPFQPSTPIPTADLESVVRRVLAEARAAEPTPEPTEPAPTIDVEALAFEVTERVLATIEARETPTPEPSPEPTPTETPTPAPASTLPDVIRSLQKSILRIAASGNHVATGVIIDVDQSTGEIYLLTRSQQVANAGPLQATTTTGTIYEAAISGADDKRDLALLRICCDTEATPIPLGDALTIQVGTEVAALAFGTASGPGLAASSGIVSSILFDSEGERWIIQADAPVSGEGGAALITPDGRFVGLVVESAGGFSYAVSEVTLSEILPTLR